METKKPLDSVGWLGGSSNRTVINEAARREASMKPWSERIPAVMAKALNEASESLNAEFGGEVWPDALREFTRKMEGLDE